jgi:hypothetical protein
MRKLAFAILSFLALLQESPAQLSASSERAPTGVVQRTINEAGLRGITTAPPMVKG